MIIAASQPHRSGHILPFSITLLLQNVYLDLCVKVTTGLLAISFTGMFPTHEMVELAPVFSYFLLFKYFVFMSTPFKRGRHIVLLRLASALALALALASGLTLRHPLLNFFLGAPKYDPSYIEIIFHW